MAAPILAAAGKILLSIFVGRAASGSGRKNHMDDDDVVYGVPFTGTPPGSAGGGGGVNSDSVAQAASILLALQSQHQKRPRRRRIWPWAMLVAVLVFLGAAGLQKAGKIDLTPGFLDKGLFSMETHDETTIIRERLVPLKVVGVATQEVSAKTFRERGGSFNFPLPFVPSIPLPGTKDKWVIIAEGTMVTLTVDFAHPVDIKVVKKAGITYADVVLGTPQTGLVQVGDAKVVRLQKSLSSLLPGGAKNPQLAAVNQELISDAAKQVNFNDRDLLSRIAGNAQAQGVGMAGTILPKLVLHIAVTPADGGAPVKAPQYVDSPTPGETTSPAPAQDSKPSFIPARAA